jgi:hypothetical protein
MAVASIDIGDYAKAQEIIKMLHSKFPDSSRVGRIEGMLLEAKGKSYFSLSLFRKP